MPPRPTARLDVVATIASLDPEWPQMPAADRARLADSRAALDSGPAGSC